MLGEAEPGLPDARIEIEVAHEPLRAQETADIADRSDLFRGGRDVHVGDREQTPHLPDG
jgi:hypothetical protein